jgi:hypothetical protein
VATKMNAGNSQLIRDAIPLRINVRKNLIS